MATRYRDLQRPTLLQTGLVDDSPERKAMALAGAFKSFERAGSDVLGGLNAIQGAQTGAAQGAAGTPQPKTGWRALTRYGEAYNNAAEVTYSNKLQTDIHERLGQLELESEADPVKYQTLSAAYRDELVKTVPPKYAPRIGDIFNARLSAGNLRIAEQAQQKTQNEALASFLESAPTRIASTLKAIEGLSPEDGDAAIAETVAETERQLEAMPWLNPVQRVQLSQSFAKDFDAAVADQRIGTVVDEIGRLARVDVFQADKALAAIDEREDLSADEKQNIRARVQQERNLLEAERSHLHYKDVAALTQRLSRDDFGVGVEREADRLYRLGAISDGEYRGFMGRSAENADRVIKARAAADAAVQVLYAGGKLDPGTAEHVKAVSTAFDSETARLGVTPGDDRWTQMVLNTTKQSNILPKSAESWMRTALLSGDAGLASRAAGLMGQLEESNPGAYEWQKEPKLDGFASLLRRNLGAGLSTQQAYETAYQNTYGATPEEIAIREQDYRTLTKNEPSEAVLRDAFTRDVPYWFDQRPPDAPAALRAEYESLERQFYVISGDLDEARKQATAKVKARWGVTEVNGAPEYTRYPIEQTYGFPPDFIRADIAALTKGYTDRPVRIKQGRTTNTTRGLEWAVEAQREDGMWEDLLGPDNRPVGYRLPISSKTFDDSKERFKAASEENLRREREEAQRRDEVTQQMMWRH